MSIKTNSVALGFDRYEDITSNLQEIENRLVDADISLDDSIEHFKAIYVLIEKANKKLNKS